VASSALSWTAEANVLSIRVLLEMAGVRGVTMVKAIQCCREMKAPTLVSHVGP